MSADATVFLVDDDASLRDALKFLLESVNMRVEAFASATDFLDALDPQRPGCLVLDIRMPGMSGLNLQKVLADAQVLLPVLIITGHGDVPMCVQAFQNGAFAFMEKPVNHQEFLDEIHRAIEHDAQQRRLHGHSTGGMIASLSPREKEVMDLIVSGKSMKLIANELGVSIQTCSKHRTRILEKLEVSNDVELVKLLLTTDS